MEKFLVVKDTIKKVRKFNLTGRYLEFKLKPVPVEEEPLGWVKGAIEQVVGRVIRGAEPNDMVGFTFCSRAFSRGEGYIKFQTVSEISFDTVWGMIGKVYQSNSAGLDTETFCLGATLVKMPVGRGRGNYYNTFDEECKVRRGIITIYNKDNMCLPRALVVALAYVTNDTEMVKIRRDRGKLQTQRALQLVEEAGVVIPEAGCGVDELQQFQDYLTDYQIIVYRHGSKGRDVVFSGPEESGRRLNLLYHEKHYNVITSLTAAFVCNYFCETCKCPYDHKSKHRCANTCTSCQQSPTCLEDGTKITCVDCNRGFRGQSCFENHKRPGSHEKTTVCEEVKRCRDCLKTIKSGRVHTCGEVYCKICSEHKPSPHNCFMPVDTGKPTMDGTLIIFYDMESTQEDVIPDGTSLLHKPNLCVFTQSCYTCIDTDLKICPTCCVRMQVLKIDPVARFTEYVLNQRKIFKRVFVIGHAGGLYDNQFILNYILTNTDLKPELITQGTKLILLCVGNLRFIDSLNYFPMPLSKLPKAFGLQGVKKGYFPHLFNKKENWNYVGPLPALEFYDPDSLKYSPTIDGKNEHEKLVEWHTELSNQNYIFDFQKELIQYCMADVQVLAQACLKFRELMIKEGGVDPFTEAVTLPGACNKIFRRNFLKPNTIGLIPKGGYRWRDNQSLIAVRWLVWEEYQRAINIQHAAKGPEAIVAGVKVDGYCSDTNEIFEFHGCYYHGCNKCIKYRRNEPTHEDPADTVESRYEATMLKTERLRSLGYHVIEIWECTFRKLLSENEELRAYTEHHPLVAAFPLNPRDAFYGGRTDATTLYYKIQNDEKIKYVDVCSLYPYVNKYGKYPVGHPEVIVGEECQKLDLNETDGLIKCKILPPTTLYHPVLPTKMNDKLMFVLCRACGENMSAKDCEHGIEERAITGTWVMDEVVKALQKGYEILEIYEIWKYQVERYNTHTKTGGLFSDYISTFLKIKQQASGWPASCITPEDRDAYVEEYMKREGVMLCPEEIATNPGGRQIGKSVITSFWGKLGQRENQTKTSIVTDPAEFFDLLSRPFIDVISTFVVNEDTLIVNWEYKYETYDVLSTVNVVLAAFTTSQARLKLYEYLEKLNNRVFYYDTDSIIYLSHPGAYEVPIGSFLGEMTDELTDYGPGSFITEFVSGGAKLYGYRVYSTTHNKYFDVIKVKGITLNYNTINHVNFESLRDMILNEAEAKFITTRNILRTSDHSVITKNVTKIFRPNFCKRKRENNYTSVPYGFKHAKMF